MRVLIVEDEFTSRTILQEIFSPYGNCDIAVDGVEAVEAFRLAWKDNKPYDLICMDIMMPNIDGQHALKKIRAIEKEMGILGSDRVKVVMSTALGDPNNVLQAFFDGVATAYVVKPINKRKLLKEVRNLGLIE
jgi:two-component system chemotaxis response regulator CheY